MPRGNKSKGRSRAKRQQTRGESKNLQGAQPAAGSQQAMSRGSPELDVPSSIYDAGAEGSDAGAEVSVAGADETSAVGAEGSDVGAEDSVADDERRAHASKLAAAIQSARRDPLTRKATVLIEFMLEKFKEKKPFTQADILRVISRKYKVHFTEILKRISVRLELVFGLELKEVDPRSQSYMLVGKLDLPNKGRVCPGRGLPKTGLLMSVLGMIFMNGNSVPEKEVWKFLNMMHVYPGRKHIIYREPRKLITQDLVKLKYLEYQQIPNSDPPCYEFLWGPKAYTETTKMKVLEFMAKHSGIEPKMFSVQYAEALEEENQKAQEKIRISPRSS
ncbi:Melanoma-associated antigen B3 [Lemmus lemmus]